jgi:hypothetical protein
MANTTIQLKFSTSTGNVPTSLELGELAINTEDGKIFYRNSSNVINSIQNFPGPAGLNTEVQFNDDGDLGSNSTFTFNKTTGDLKTTSLILNNNSKIGSINVSTTTTSQQTLFSFPSNTFGAAKFVVLATENNRKQVTEILVVQDTTSAYATEYAIIKTNGNIFDLETDINLGSVRLLTTGVTSNPIDYVVTYTLL